MGAQVSGISPFFPSLEGLWMNAFSRTNDLYIMSDKPPT